MTTQLIDVNYTTEDDDIYDDTELMQAFEDYYDAQMYDEKSEMLIEYYALAHRQLADKGIGLDTVAMINGMSAYLESIGIVDIPEVADPTNQFTIVSLEAMGSDLKKKKENSVKKSLIKKLNISDKISRLFESKLKKYKRVHAELSSKYKGSQDNMSSKMTEIYVPNLMEGVTYDKEFHSNCVKGKEIEAKCWKEVIETYHKADRFDLRASHREKISEIDKIEGSIDDLHSKTARLRKQYTSSKNKIALSQYKWSSLSSLLSTMSKRIESIEHYNTLNDQLDKKAREHTVPYLTHGMATARYAVLTSGFWATTYAIAINQLYIKFLYTELKNTHKVISSRLKFSK